MFFETKYDKLFAFRQNLNEFSSLKSPKLHTKERKVQVYNNGLELCNELLRKYFNDKRILCLQND